MSTNKRNGKTVVQNSVALQRSVRVRRLAKIAAAQAELESCLLTLRDHCKIDWDDSGFRSLYYLMRLAKRAP
jgi:hypothetical protein